MSEMDIYDREFANQEVSRQMMSSLKIAFTMSFMKKNKKDMKIKKSLDGESDEEVKQAKKTKKSKKEVPVDLPPTEFVSDRAMVVTEALYKFVRRNQNM
jgi:hypothetical protein